MREILKDKRGGFLVRHFVVGAILFSMVIAFYVLYVGSLSNEYIGIAEQEIVSDSFARNYDKLDDITGKVDTMKNTTQSGEGLSFRGLFDVTFGAAFTAIQLVFSSLNIFGDMSVNVIADFTFLDAHTVRIFFISGFAIITTILVFVWLSSISRGKI